MPTTKEFCIALEKISELLPGAVAVIHSHGRLEATYHGQPWVRIDIGQIVLMALTVAEDSRRADQQLGEIK